MDELVIYKGSGDGIVTLTLNRPELRNPISDREMVDALLAILGDKTAGVGIAVQVKAGGDLARHFGLAGIFRRPGVHIGFDAAFPGAIGDGAIPDAKSC